MVKAFELAGVVPRPEFQVTIDVFRTLLHKHPTLSLDQAILSFEQAPEGVTLMEFADRKHRTAEGYRQRFRPFFALAGGYDHEKTKTTRPPFLSPRPPSSS
jgi:hypothetical protein